MINSRRSEIGFILSFISPLMTTREHHALYIAHVSRLPVTNEGSKWPLSTLMSFYLKSQYCPCVCVRTILVRASSDPLQASQLKGFLKALLAFKNVRFIFIIFYHYIIPSNKLQYVASTFINHINLSLYLQSLHTHLNFFKWSRFLNYFLMLRNCEINGAILYILPFSERLHPTEYILVGGLSEGPGSTQEI